MIKGVQTKEFKEFEKFKELEDASAPGVGLRGKPKRRAFIQIVSSGYSLNSCNSSDSSNSFHGLE